MRRLFIVLCVLLSVFEVTVQAVDPVVKSQTIKERVKKLLRSKRGKIAAGASGAALVGVVAGMIYRHRMARVASSSAGLPSLQHGAGLSSSPLADLPALQRELDLSSTPLADLPEQRAEEREGNNHRQDFFSVGEDFEISIDSVQKAFGLVTSASELPLSEIFYCVRADQQTHEECVKRLDKACKEGDTRARDLLISSFPYLCQSIANAQFENICNYTPNEYTLELLFGVGTAFNRLWPRIFECIDKKQLWKKCLYNNFKKIRKYYVYLNNELLTKLLDFYIAGVEDDSFNRADRVALIAECIVVCINQLRPSFYSGVHKCVQSAKKSFDSVSQDSFKTALSLEKTYSDLVKSDYKDIILRQWFECLVDLGNIDTKFADRIRSEMSGHMSLELLEQVWSQQLSIVFDIKRLGGTVLNKNLIESSTVPFHCGDVPAVVTFLKSLLQREYLSADSFTEIIDIWCKVIILNSIDSADVNSLIKFVVKNQNSYPKQACAVLCWLYRKGYQVFPQLLDLFDQYRYRDCGMMYTILPEDHFAFRIVDFAQNASHDHAKECIEILSSYFIKTSSIVESMRSIALNHQKLAGYILEKLWSAFDKSQHKRVILETLKGIIMYSDDSRRQGLKFLDKKASVFFTGPPTLEAVPDGVYWKIMSYSEMDDSSLKKKVLALLYTCIKKQKSDGKELKNDGLYTFWMDRYPALEIPNR